MSKLTKPTPTVDPLAAALDAAGLPIIEWDDMPAEVRAAWQPSS